MTSRSALAAVTSAVLVFSAPAAAPPEQESTALEKPLWLLVRLDESDVPVPAEARYFQIAVRPGRSFRKTVSLQGITTTVSGTISFVKDRYVAEMSFGLEPQVGVMETKMEFELDRPMASCGVNVHIIWGSVLSYTREKWKAKGFLDIDAAKR
jgi:hypothetical protein